MWLLFWFRSQLSLISIPDRFIGESDKTLSNMILRYTVDWGKLVIKPGISENFSLSSHQSCLFTIQTSILRDNTKLQPRPQGLLLNDFQKGGSSGEDPGRG